MIKEKELKHKSANYKDIQSLITPNETLRVLQDKGLEYAESLGCDNMKEEGIAYGSFVAACIFMESVNKNK